MALGAGTGRQSSMGLGRKSVLLILLYQGLRGKLNLKITVLWYKKIWTARILFHNTRFPWTSGQALIYSNFMQMHTHTALQLQPETPTWKTTRSSCGERRRRRKRKGREAVAQGQPRKRIQTCKPSQRRPPEAGSRGKERQNGAPAALD